METVTFTCTAPGSTIIWVLSDVSDITVTTTSVAVNVSEIVRGYIVTLTAVTNTSLTSTLSRVAEDGIIVSCIATMPIVDTIGSTTVTLVGELLFLIKSPSHNNYYAGACVVSQSPKPLDLDSGLTGCS